MNRCATSPTAGPLLALFIFFIGVRDHSPFDPAAGSTPTGPSQIPLQGRLIMSDQDKREVDEISGVETTGHEMGGIKELNNPLPALVAVDLLRDHRVGRSAT